MESDHTADAVAGGDDLPPLKITCTTALCDQGTHCMKPRKRRGKSQAQPSLFPEPPGSCRACGEHIVDMPRVQLRDPADAEHTVASLRRETIRHEYWRRPFDDKALAKARAAGFDGVIAAAERRMRRKDLSSEAGRIFRDGIQTPLSGDVVFYAQHAMACCCRQCMEYWHGIPRDRPLGEEEIRYFVGLITRYVSERLPDLVRPAGRETGAGDA